MMVMFDDDDDHDHDHDHDDDDKGGYDDDCVDEAINDGKYE